jgi:WD40 repeat protein
VIDIPEATHRLRNAGTARRELLLEGGRDVIGIPAPADSSGPRLVLQAGHGGSVNSVAFSPDGRRILTGSSTGMATLWDTDTGRPTRDLGGHGGPVSSVAFGLDGRRVLTDSHDRTAIPWDAETARPLVTSRGHAGGVYAVAISPDGRRILAGPHDGTARLWDIVLGHELPAVPIAGQEFRSSSVLRPDTNRPPRCARRSDDTEATWSGATDIPDPAFPVRHNGSPAVWATEMGDAIRCSSPETFPINGDGWRVPLRPGVGFAPIQSLWTRPGPYWNSAPSYTSVAPVS